MHRQAQTKDYTVLSVIEQEKEILYLRHLKIFKQPTKYATVLGYLKALQDRWGGFQKIRVDFTRRSKHNIRHGKRRHRKRRSASTLAYHEKAKWQAY